ncbi:MULTISPECIES: ABC transporter ATP-binding protein [unclassified Rhizobium]|uniref:ABC transporter ATP-binding protein n=1 Tax=unclassified Rhizobium TaxID=2613769 RepID=UPI00160920FE|nr:MULTISPECIES: ABC transporter ATP-binding protein [unclassified Rhizobium]MBB3285537.1 peptide/nickel transport system ATP-binding protein [Rhizobium sp. BK252]MBB3400277.1 peptide/nickel transport system ATP-binding protein [Rhizobium sp. BK289]MBB3412856.1 peptide/nickel transport system ATP-binding protein [Rhizobium sp. BK284]MBB3480743.1 peptide/nickel transport system ATP-binding protein [Rhizobium sp. BK347]MDK4719402.1 ABC transporter ATP-binding protein [Rhizobium sp. CNPSo 3968]
MSDLLSLSHVSKVYRQGGMLSRRQIVAVRNVNLSLGEEPEILSIVGESGSGKSTIASMILGQTAPTSGSLNFRGRPVAIHGRSERRAFMREVQPVLQNPFEAFNPLKRVDRYLFETARNFAPTGVRPSRADVERMADEALAHIGLTLAEVKGRFPHELSGGQLQRTAIARALIPQPRLLVADEPVSMVDASLRMAIVNLFGQLKKELGLSIIYITHDLATAYYISDRIIIMKKGEIVEQGGARAVLDNPQHPYSRALKEAVLSTTPEVEPVSIA